MGTSFLEPVAPPAGNGLGAPHPVKAALKVAGAGYVALTGALLLIGVVLTHALDGSVGAWDEHVNEWFVARRTNGWSHITQVATLCFNTEPVVAAAFIIVGLLAWRRRFREAAFLTVGLLVEITVFLSVTFVVARPRPDVPRMNSTPATSSFPSGHTAAATVLLAGLALIVTCCTDRRVLRVAAAVIAALIAVTVGFARVYRGLHHPTDVVIGVLYGAGCLVVAAIAVRAGSVAAAQRVRDRNDGAVKTDGEGASSTVPKPAA
jgi:undecaprenyl-diphosphatase